MTTSEILTSIGFGLTFLVGSINLIFTFWNSKRTIFINSITVSRIKYIQDLRESFAGFCSLAYTYHARINDKPDYFWELQKESDKLKFMIHLFLNPEDDYWANKVHSLMEKIISKTDKSTPELKGAIDDLVLLSQYLLKFEWEVAKMESKSGILSNKRKNEIYNYYIDLHKKISTK